MERDKLEAIKKAIHDRSATLKNPPKPGQTNKRQYDDTLDAIRAERRKIVNSSYERVADYLFNEGYAGSFQDALIVADVISEDWYDEIVEATSATRATVRGRVRVPGSAQRATAREDRKAEARARAEERNRQQEAERKYAKERRTNPEILKREAQKRTLSTRMERAAARMGLQ